MRKRNYLDEIFINSDRLDQEFQSLKKFFFESQGINNVPVPKNINEKLLDIIIPKLKNNPTHTGFFYLYERAMVALQSDGQVYEGYDIEKMQDLLESFLNQNKYIFEVMYRIFFFTLIISEKDEDAKKMREWLFDEMDQLKIAIDELAEDLLEN